MSETINVEAIFGENVFNDSVMKERLPKSVYKKLKQTIEDGSDRYDDNQSGNSIILGVCRLWNG